MIIKENNVIKINESLYELLKANTKRKNIEEVLLKQIKEKDIQINRLHDLIENNQILIKNSQEREKEQASLENHFKDIDKKLLEIRDKNKNRKEKKRKSNIFQKILKV